MKDPPLTPYAVAGFTNDADLDCAQAVADFGYAPRGVRAGLASCLSATATTAAATTAAPPPSSAAAQPEKRTGP
jgi:hypothetical protein